MSTISVPHSNPLAGVARFLRAINRRWLFLAGALLLAGAIAAALATAHARSATTYVTAPVTQQTLVQTVTASGVVNPQNSISVGTQVSGTISQIDVDFNSKVKKGQVLARLDPSTLSAQLDQAQAALAQAQAQAAQAGANASGAAAGVDVAAANARAQEAAVTAAQANVDKAKASLALADDTLNRDSSLLAQGYVARSTVDTDRSNAAQDQADVAAAQAAVAQAQAQLQAGSATVGQNGSTEQAQAAGAQAARANVEAAQAVVQQDQVNLGHTVITSPVDGTVVAREVSVGQTVAASLQTPTLFSIAQNLGKMEVDINVGEPDIGNVKPGQTVDFSVLAYPNRVFHGTVSQVRINPQTVNNVVTYDVVVLVDNKDGALLPGMTANASIEVATARNALVVPLTALQWNPRASQKATTTSAAGSASPWGAVAAGAGGGSAIATGANGRIFVQRGGKLQRVPVTVALATATQAAVTPSAGASLQSGDAVVVASSGGTARAGSGSSSRSPMSPARVGPGAMRGIH
ncbi:MAG TPA: efflux RND transporter periplasmic adaptor subunit [Candidatus Baltobacteraceae bacterium]|nr:efflux RND transporter periplasmic adaptor subunit [Candidatus Baltobacteraceae bacterium]